MSSASSRPSLPKIRVEEIHHRPQVARFLDVHLEEVAHVVERRRGERQPALLLHRAGLGVALRDDQAAQFVAMFARALPPSTRRRCSRRNGSGARPSPARGRSPSDTPACARSRTPPSPTSRRSPRCAGRSRSPGGRPGPGRATIRGNCGCQRSSARRSFWFSFRFDVVGNELFVVHQTLLQSNSGECGLPYDVSAPCSPTALGRVNIQFCHAESRA